jgi:hypothetical protein
MRDEKRTILVNWQQEDVIVEIWEHERQTAGEEIDNRPPIEHTSSVDFNSLKDRREYNGVSYWVIERGLPDFDTWSVKNRNP